MTLDPSAPETWPVLMTVEEVALVARLSPSTIRQHSARGKFRPAAIDGRPLRWRRCDVVRAFEPVTMAVLQRRQKAS